MHIITKLCQTNTYVCIQVVKLIQQVVGAVAPVRVAWLGLSVQMGVMLHQILRKQRVDYDVWELLSEGVWGVGCFFKTLWVNLSSLEGKGSIICKNDVILIPLSWPP